MKRPPLACRIAQVDKAEQKTKLVGIIPFLQRPELLTPTILRNPLIADELEIQVKNTSGGDLEIFTEGVDKSPFLAEALIRDQAGHEIIFQRSVLIGVARSMHCPQGAMSPRLKAGQVVKQRLSPWELLAPEDALKPGRYTIRVRCFYFLAQNEKERQIESDPVEISITTNHIREWSKLRKQRNAMPFVPVLGP